MSDQHTQESPTDGVPEVVPSEHLLPEDPLLQAGGAVSAEPVSSTAGLDTPTVESEPKVELAADIPIGAPEISEAPPPEAEPIELPPVEPVRSTPLPRPVPARKERYTLVTVVSALRSIVVTFGAAVIVATIFMWWTSPNILSAQTQKDLARAQATAQQILVTPTAVPTSVYANRIGVIAGHSGIATYGRTKGNIDPGTVCPDNFTELSVTTTVAAQVVALLRGRGFEVDLLEEWDLRLDKYQAAAFISLHADSCVFFDDGFNHTGFKSTYPTGRYTIRDQDTRLDDCIRANYGAVTGLPFTPDSITENMTDYHAFHQITPGTPAVILELGNLRYDRDLLQNHTDKLAQGIVDGLLCFLQPQPPPLPPTSPVTPTTVTGPQPTQANVPVPSPTKS